MENPNSYSENKQRDIAKEIAKNFLMGFGTVRKWRAKRPRAGAYFTGDDAELVRYAFSGLDLLREHIGSVKNKSVLEIGAGDYLTSGFSMLAAGAKFYGVIDRFPGPYSSETAKKWYAAIEENWERFYPDIRWADGLHAADFPENYSRLLELIPQEIEKAETTSRYDVICSFQVGEHVTDIDAFAEVHNRLLNKSGGVGVHRVDFGPHDCWTLYKDPLTFLHFSDQVWRMSGSNRGTPNRFRHHEFLDAFKRANLSVDVALTENFDESRIDFKQLKPRFQDMPHDSLLVGTAVYLLRPQGA
jgi:hypothetical protein